MDMGYGAGVVAPIEYLSGSRTILHGTSHVFVGAIGTSYKRCFFLKSIIPFHRIKRESLISEIRPRRS
jgi:hypothetical protein